MNVIAQCSRERLEFDIFNDSFMFSVLLELVKYTLSLLSAANKTIGGRVK